MWFVPLQRFSKCVSYFEMPLQQGVVTERSGGHLLSKCRSVTSVSRKQPLTSSSRRYWAPLVRCCTAISVIWGATEEICGESWHLKASAECVYACTLGQPDIRSVTSPLQKSEMALTAGSDRATQWDTSTCSRFLTFMHSFWHVGSRGDERKI